jgi:hypothetical protein
MRFGFSGNNLASVEPCVAEVQPGVQIHQELAKYRQHCARTKTCLNKEAPQRWAIAMVACCQELLVGGPERRQSIEQYVLDSSTSYMHIRKTSSYMERALCRSPKTIALVTSLALRVGEKVRPIVSASSAYAHQVPVVQMIGRLATSATLALGAEDPSNAHIR